MKQNPHSLDLAHPNPNPKERSYTASKYVKVEVCHDTSLSYESQLWQMYFTIISIHFSTVLMVFLVQLFLCV